MGIFKDKLRSLLPPRALAVPRTYFPWHPYFLDFERLRTETCENGERSSVGPARQPTQHDHTDLLQQLAAKHEPSKAQQDYIRHYAAHFGPIRDRVRSLVEIGVQSPRSLNMWEEYFPNATIYGLDIDPACEAFTGGRRRVFIGDQKDPVFLRRLIAETGGGFDIVIDDGEHSEPAILKTFSVLFPALADHGLYAVEDIENLPRVSRFFRELERNVNYWPNGFAESDWQRLRQFDNRATWLDRNVVGLHFYRYLCVVNRGFNPEDNPSLK
jgi:hypothetical protein